MSEIETNVRGFCRSDLHLTTPYVKPEAKIEADIAEIWQHVLDVDIIGVQDDFFEIGGDSLAATVLASELETRFNCKVSPSTMIEISTVAAQASYVNRQQTNRAQRIDDLPSCLILFNAEGTKQPLFIVHGNRGFTLYGKEFLAGFDKDRPIGFLEAPGLDGKETILGPIEDYAEHYLDAIRKVAPEGNWQIASNCAGGLIALEMCLLSETRGERVSKLIMVDPISGRRLIDGPMRRGSKRGRRSRNDRGVKGRGMRLLRFLSFGSPDDDDNDEAAFEASLDDFAQRHRSYNPITSRSENTGALVSSNTSYNPDAMQQVSDNLELLYQTYSLHQKWEGNSFILSSRARSKGLDIWKDYLPGVSCCVVKYDHRDLFTEGLPDIVAFLNEAMSAHPEKHLT